MLYTSQYSTLFGARIVSIPTPSDCCVVNIANNLVKDACNVSNAAPVSMGCLLSCYFDTSFFNTMHIFFVEDSLSAQKLAT